MKTEALLIIISLALVGLVPVLMDSCKNKDTIEYQELRLSAYRTKVYETKEAYEEALEAFKAQERTVLRMRVEQSFGR